MFVNLNVSHSVDSVVFTRCFVVLQFHCRCADCFINITGSRCDAGQIQIGAAFLQTSFSILEEQPMDMLLGLDMLKRHQVSITVFIHFLCAYHRCWCLAYACILCYAKLVTPHNTRIRNYFNTTVSAYAAWYQFVRNDDVWRLTKQPKLTAVIQSRRLTLFGHIMRMDDNADARGSCQPPLQQTGEDNQVVPASRDSALSNRI